MNPILITIIYVTFFGLIGFAVYFTSSAWPLLALLLTPIYRHTKEHDDDDDGTKT